VAATTAGVGGDGLDTVKAPKGFFLCARSPMAMDAFALGPSKFLVAKFLLRNHQVN
jgi:hypothetical protein